MGSHKYTVEFRVYGKELDPKSISMELGLHPIRVFNSGTIFLGKKRQESMWGYNGSDDGNELEWDVLEDGLVFLLDKLWHKRDVISKYNAKYESSLWCGHFQSSFDGGPSFSPELLKRLGDFGIKIFIDCHFVDEGS